jgi:hypothetical protein
MDEIRAEFWEQIRSLFPENAVDLPLEHGDLLVSWKINDDPVHPHKRSTPIYLRFEPALLERMRRVSAPERQAIAAREVHTVKTGLCGYEPDNRVQNARFIVLG